MFLLPTDPNDLRFPPAERASPEGLLAVGGDLSPQRLLAAYRSGVFPWYSDDQPILWWSPDPRAVLFPDRFRVSRSLAKRLRSGRFTVTMDESFREVMLACAGPRQDRNAGTWITAEMIEAYSRLHEMGYAHSVETWHEDKLVGGLYGVSLGAAFFGESMFSHATDASKVALARLVAQLRRWDFRFIDCQLASDHLYSLGAEDIPRERFLALLAAALEADDRRGRWRLEQA
jgi:leucyl/phenylalanyl-tRNA--protein transferase